MQTYNPFGLRPAYHPSGITRPVALGFIESGYATPIFQNAPVWIDADGFLEARAAGNDNVFLGTFQGVEYLDTLMKFTQSNQWVAGTAATQVRAYYTLDPLQVYEIQANAALTIDAIGGQANYTAQAGNTTTGLSSVGLDVSTLVETADTLQLRIIGLNPGPDNDWSDLFPVVLVQISAHSYVARVDAL